MGMAKPVRARISHAVLAFLAFLALLAVGCSSMFDSRHNDVGEDGGHTELLAGVWTDDSHTLDLRSDSTYSECLKKNWPKTCVQGRYTPGTSNPAFAPATCSMGDSLLACADLDQSLGDTSAHAESVLMTLRHKDRRFEADVIVDRECVRSRPVILGEVCTKLGDPTGILRLDLTVEGAPVWNRVLYLSRSTNPDTP
jgi:hypothetical protein